MGLPILKIIGGIAKKVLFKSGKQAGADESTIDKIAGTVEEVIEHDDEVQEMVQEFLLSFEGKYSELKTKFEGIVRTMLRPILTLGVVTNIIILIWKGFDIPQILGWMGVILVSSWCGTKAFRDWKKVKTK